MADYTEARKSGGSPGSTGTGSNRSSQALAPTGGATSTQIALHSGGGQLNRWPVPEGYVELDDAAFRRSSQSLFNKPAATGMWFGLGVNAGLTLLVGLSFLIFSIVGATIATGLLFLAGVMFSLTAMPKIFEKLNDTAPVKLYRDIDVYLSGYFYGFGMGQFFFLAPTFTVLCLLLKR